VDFRTVLLCRLLGLAVFAGVRAFGQQLPGFIAPVAGIFQANLRVDAQRQQLSFAVKPEAKAPPFIPGRGHEQEKPPLIEQLDGLHARLGVADSSIGQGHWA
jgi:hypothetical protein